MVMNRAYLNELMSQLFSLVFVISWPSDIKIQMPFLSMKSAPNPMDEIAQTPKALMPCTYVPLEPTPASSTAVGPRAHPPPPEPGQHVWVCTPCSPASQWLSSGIICNSFRVGTWVPAWTCSLSILPATCMKEKLEPNYTDILTNRSSPSTPC